MTDYSVFPLYSLPMPGSGGKTEPFTASDVLLKAAERISEEGMWCQKRFFADSAVELAETAFTHASQQARVAECALGALLSVTDLLGLPFTSYNEAAHRLETFLLAEHGQWVSIFNDTPGRTAHEVAAAMRQAAM